MKCTLFGKFKAYLKKPTQQSNLSVESDCWNFVLLFVSAAEAFEASRFPFAFNDTVGMLPYSCDAGIWTNFIYKSIACHNPWSLLIVESSVFDILLLLSGYFWCFLSHVSLNTFQKRLILWILHSWPLRRR